MAALGSNFGCFFAAKQMQGKNTRIFITVAGVGQLLPHARIQNILERMMSAGRTISTEFRVKKGEALFQDGEDSVNIHYLQKQVEGEWLNVFQLTLECGRSWGDEIDSIYRHRLNSGELLIHVSGYGYWGDTEYYRSTDDGLNWLPTGLRRAPDPAVYAREILELV
jgi:hypothetical protein